MFSFCFCFYSLLQLTQRLFTMISVDFAAGAGSFLLLSPSNKRRKFSVLTGKD